MMSTHTHVLRFCACVSVYMLRHRGMHIPVAIGTWILVYMEICISWHTYIKTQRTHILRHVYHDMEMSRQHACRDMHKAYCNMHTGVVTWKHMSRCTHECLDMKLIKTCMDTAICVLRSQDKQHIVVHRCHNTWKYHDTHRCRDTLIDVGMSTVCWGVLSYMLRYACACQNMHIKVCTPFTHWYTYMYVDIYIFETHGLQHTRLPCPSRSPEFIQSHVHWVGDAI